MTDELAMIWTTVPTRAEAEAIARALIEERLAACVQFDTIDSCFRWDGAVRMEAEVRLAIKTSAARAQAVVARVVGLHSYDVPEVMAVPVAGGHPAYLEWVRSELA